LKFFLSERFSGLFWWMGPTK